MENILVPIPSLEASPRTFACAQWFAGHAGSKISVLFAGGSHGPAPDPEELREEITKMAGIRSEELRSVLVCPEVANALHVTRAAKTEKADLIVIPANFFKGTSHFFQADPMDQLIHLAPCPILIVGNARSETAR